MNHRHKKVELLSRVWLFATPWTVAYQAPLSMEFSSQDYWSGLPFPSPGDLPNPGIEPRSPALQTGALPSEPRNNKTISWFATPWTVAYQAPPSMGLSRQEYWSGLPFPSPMHESEKWKWSRFSRVWLLATPWTAAYQAPPSMGLSRQEYWSGVPSPSLGFYPRSL